MIRRPPRSTLFPTRRSSDLSVVRRAGDFHDRAAGGRQRAELLGVHGTAVRAQAVRVRRLRSGPAGAPRQLAATPDRKSTRLNSSHVEISYAVFCLKKKKKTI